MENLVTANIRSRPTRAFISILAVSLGIILLLVVGGIVNGTLNDSLNRTVSMGADFILQSPGSSMMFAFSDANLNVKYADLLREVPGVADVTSVYSKLSTKPFGLVFGIDLPTFDKFPGRLQIVEGTPSLAGDEVIVDQSFAEAKKLTLGDMLDVMGHEYKITAICRSGAIVRVFVPLKTFQERNASPDKVSMMFVKATPGADLSQVQAALEAKFAGYSILPASDPDLLLLDAPLPGFYEFRILLVVVSMLLAFMIILLAMYTTIFERTREIGILKSLGASRQFIVGMILKESVIICGLGVIFGIVASEVIRAVIVAKFPTLQVAITMFDLGKGLVLGILAGVLGALYPAYKAASMDPVRALSYE